MSNEATDPRASLLRAAADEYEPVLAEAAEIVHAYIDSLAANEIKAAPGDIVVKLRQSIGPTLLRFATDRRDWRREELRLTDANAALLAALTAAEAERDAMRVALLHAVNRNHAPSTGCSGCLEVERLSLRAAGGAR